jgi:superfamily I DNA/RNA helicase
MVSAEMLADRFSAGGPALTTAERAAADRSWTYGHVVVDEAQELSAMAWRVLLRRVPTRSLTIVGDVAQTTARAGAQSWARVFDPLLRDQWRLAELTVNYRTPASVAEAAGRVAVAAGLPVSPLTSARDVPDALRVEAVDGAQLAAVAARRAEEQLAAVLDDQGAGRVAVVGSAARLTEVRAQLDGRVPAAGTGAARATVSNAAASAAAGTEDAGGRRATDLDAPLVLLTPLEAKGLEFDVVVLLEPAEILAASAGDLYVAMTRPTRALHVVHGRPLPAGLVETPS